MIDQIQRQQLQAQRRGINRISKPVSVSAPIKGWNTRDPFEAMDPLDAIQLDNWFPDVTGVVTRGGSAVFASGLGSKPVSTLATFQSGSTNQLLAACTGAISNISSGGGPALSSGFGSDIWQTVNFNRHQFWVNGTDSAQIYDGTTLANASFTGVSTNSLSGIGVFNNRLYFWTGNDPSFYYGPVLGISGALTNFDLSMVSLAGGNLISVEVLSYDGGTGVDDYTCFFMSSGEVLMYSGTDPSNPNNWSLVGRYLLPPPVATRAIARYGGDIYLATANDHQQLSKLLIALRLGEVPPRTKISGAATAAYQAGASLPGWQALYYPARTWILFNIPNPDGTFSQHIYNTSTQAWARLRNWNANCFGLYKGNLYFGTKSGTVLIADTGSSDGSSPILSTAQQSWQLFGSPLKKRVTAIRPVVQTQQGSTDFAFALGYDYQPSNPPVPDSTLSNSTSLIWGRTNWGSPHIWGGVGVTDPRWHIAGGEGGAVGMALSANTLIGATWIRTDLLIEPGSAL